MRGKAKTIYMKPEVENKVNEYCEKTGISFSMLIRIALMQYIEQKESQD